VAILKVSSLSPLQTPRIWSMTFKLMPFTYQLSVLKLLRSAQAGPSGWNMLARHPDGAIVEYVQHHDPHPADVMSNIEYSRDFAFGNS
jgi:hypothetical protein